MCKTAVLRRRFACPERASNEKFTTSHRCIVDAVIMLVSKLILSL